MLDLLGEEFLGVTLRERKRGRKAGEETPQRELTGWERNICLDAFSNSHEGKLSNSLKVDFTALFLGTWASGKYVCLDVLYYYKRTSLKETRAEVWIDLTATATKTCLSVMAILLLSTWSKLLNLSGP